MRRQHLCTDMNMGENSRDGNTHIPQSLHDSDKSLANNGVAASLPSPTSSSTDSAFILISARAKLLDHTLPRYRAAAPSATAAHRADTALDNLWLRTTFDYELLGDSESMGGKERAVMVGKDARRVRADQKRFRVSKRGNRDGSSGRVGSCVIRSSARAAYQRAMTGKGKVGFGGEGDRKWMVTSGVRRMSRLWVVESAGDGIVPGGTGRGLVSQRREQRVQEGELARRVILLQAAKRLKAGRYKPAKP